MNAFCKCFRVCGILGDGGVGSRRESKHLRSEGHAGEVRAAEVSTEESDMEYCSCILCFQSVNCFHQECLEHMPMTVLC